ncbi:MAG: lamin tail domain-containing protein, partial [Parabacteroides sp.]
MFNVKGGRLQLGISPTTSGTAVIGMNISYAPDMQWEFDIQMNSAPSDNNKLWVYLYRTDSTEYFNLQIGYNKERKLGLRHNGKDIIRNDGNNYQKDSWVHFKVTLEKNRYWTLYSRQHDSTYYVKEGACDCTVKDVKNGQFCFKFVYTKTKSDLFSIDNIKISNKITPTDTSGFSIPEEQNPTPIELPVIKSLEIIDLSSLQLLFNKAVNIEKAAFNLTDIGLATKQSYADETHERINIFFAKELETDKFYTISYKGIKDLSGNELPEYSQEIKIEKEDEDNNNEKEDNSTITPGSIIINEIMADPKGLTSLPETEYVELHNTTDKALSLAGCLFVYDTSAK